MREQIELVQRQFEGDRYARRFGIVLDELTEGTVRMHMPLGEETLNFFGRPHGGAVYALADAAFSVLVNNANNLSVALDCSISYHASPEPDATLTVEGEILSLTRRTAACLFKVYTHGEEPTLVATMKSVAYRTGKPIDPQVAQ